MRKLVLTFCLFLIIGGVKIAQAGWEKYVFPTLSSAVTGIGVGDLRNDDTLRLYVVQSMGNIIEYTFREGVWHQTLIHTLPTSVNTMIIDIGRNDGKRRIYAACFDSHIHEVSFENGLWAESDLGGPAMPFEMLDVVVGEVRNDGIKRVYAGNPNGKVYEYTYNDTAWVMDSISVNRGAIYRMAIAEGRNDGQKRLYVDPSNGELCEITYNIGNWQTNYFGLVGGVYNGLAVGKARNDDTNRVYGWTFHDINLYTLYEWTFRGNWVGKLLDTCRGEMEFRMIIDSARNDEINRLYTVAYNHLYESYYTNNTLETDTIEHYNYFACLCIGKVKNDSITRLYAGTKQEIFEYTFMPQGVIDVPINSTKSDKRHIEIYPSPIVNKGVIKYELDCSAIVSVNIYNVLGNKINTIYEGQNSPGTHFWSYDVNGIKPGIYIVRLNIGKLSVNKKIIIFR